METASKNLVVHCDICQEQMSEQGDVYFCYPCKNIIYESDLWRYDSQVRRAANATSGD
jgi:hypothetical protein